jgi:hypothetical protein
LGKLNLKDNSMDIHQEVDLEISQEALRRFKARMTFLVV